MVMLLAPGDCISRPRACTRKARSVCCRYRHIIQWKKYSMCFTHPDGTDTYTIQGPSTAEAVLDIRQDTCTSTHQLTFDESNITCTPQKSTVLCSATSNVDFHVDLSTKVERSTVIIKTLLDSIM
ncbi:hypothetical protein QCA50_014098 [Cerrena zonata]|uniref:Phlebovirus glycoprotein G2 fusion domain-containing protein n=1 Tax=Cerrena zonata TaxID=2478898 RepID=A0AAW0FV29_9APHY